MPRLVNPKVYLTGYTVIDSDGLCDYLKDTGQSEFIDDIMAAKAQGLSDGEILCSFYAKLCYKSLVVGKNDNITKTRSVKDNLENCMDVGHSSVLSHATINFVATNVSRIFTHELVRHGVGTAFSQTSGRYCRLDELEFVSDPILEKVPDLIADHLASTERLVYLLECRFGLRKPPERFPDIAAGMCFSLSECRHYLRSKGVDVEQLFNHKIPELLRWVPDYSLPMDQRKKITSSIRRIAPNGQANEIGFTVNIRSLRHIVQMRTSRHAEWEIRAVFEQVYRIVSEKFPLIFYGAEVEEVDDLLEVSGMIQQPYQTRK